MVAGHFRGIPFWWRLIDCSFGIIGIVPLAICLKNIKRLEVEEKEKSETKEAFDMLIA
jgi:Na+/melibiose symporter-like transporter